MNEIKMAIFTRKTTLTGQLAISFISWMLRPEWYTDTCRRFLNLGIWHILSSSEISWFRLVRHWMKPLLVSVGWKPSYYLADLWDILWLQGDTSGCDEPPVDIKTQVLSYPGQARTGQDKTELLFWSQQGVLHNLMCHPALVNKFP